MVCNEPESLPILDTVNMTKPILHHQDYSESNEEVELNASKCLLEQLKLESQNLLGNEALMGTLKMNSLRSLLPVIPIADLGTGDEPHSKFPKHEIILRNQLASLYRLTDLYQWSQGIYNHISVKLPDEHGNSTNIILMHPFGLLFHEVTASSLIEFDLNSEVLDYGSTGFKENKPGLDLHSAIHKARSDAQCVLHLHTPVVSAISAMKCGLLPICQEAMLIGPVAYHDYNGIIDGDKEKQNLIKDLGDKNVLILHNHGFVVCGISVPDVLLTTFNLILACETQIRAMKIGVDHLIMPNPDAIKQAYKSFRGGCNFGKQKDSKNQSVSNEQESNYSNNKKWGIGELDWEAWMRVLDSAGYKSGHNYRQHTLPDSICHFSH